LAPVGVEHYFSHHLGNVSHTTGRRSATTSGRSGHTRRYTKQSYRHTASDDYPFRSQDVAVSRQYSASSERNAIETTVENGVADLFETRGLDRFSEHPCRRQSTTNDGQMKRASFSGRFLFSSTESRPTPATSRVMTTIRTSARRPPDLTAPGSHVRHAASGKKEHVDDTRDYRADKRRARVPFFRVFLAFFCGTNCGPSRPHDYHAVSVYD